MKTQPCMGLVTSPVLLLLKLHFSKARSCTDFVAFLSTVTHEQLKERGLFSLPPPPAANPADYYHLMASHRNPYGELLMQTGAAAAAAAAAHLPDYMSPVDSK